MGSFFQPARLLLQLVERSLAETQPLRLQKRQRNTADPKFRIPLVRKQINRTEAPLEAPDQLLHIERARNIHLLRLCLLLLFFTQQRVGRGRRFLAVMLMNRHALVREISVVARRPELRRNGRQCVTGRSRPPA